MTESLSAADIAADLGRISPAENAAREVVATNMRVLMARHNMKPADLADSLGVHVVWVRRRLTASVDPSLGDLVRIAAVLETSVAELVGGEA